jgi:hypothetical protein
MKYLCNTIEWGIIYLQPKPNMALPDVPLDIRPSDPTLPTVQEAASHLQLYGYVDASHANDLPECRSTTKNTFLLSGRIVAYRSKTQSITATSSTKAEFLVAVSSGKVAKYFRSILSQLGFPQQGPTPICENNDSTI